jgi:hypothetical protein
VSTLRFSENTESARQRRGFAPQASSGSRAEEPGLSRAEALRRAMLRLIDGPGSVDAGSGRTAFSYAHPIFWAPFSLVGDGGRVETR